MKQSRTQVFFLPSERSVTRAFHTGVSLHSHTEHSQERLDDLPRYLDRMPVVSQFLRWERKRYLAATGENLPFSRAYWRGPLSAQSAYDLERLQIERLGLGALVSLTDHDTIDAGLLLQSERAAGEIPISVEWTVPYEQTYFHLGIHNLDPSLAVAFMQEFAHYTRKPQPYALGQLFEALEADPGVLVVLNHPLWDMAAVGRAQLAGHVREFLHAYGRHIHALEINGLRSWPENMSVVSLGREFDYPVVAGGDRHGLEPNATINLTRAKTFASSAPATSPFCLSIRNRWRSAICSAPGTRCASIRSLQAGNIGLRACLSCATTEWSALFPRSGPTELRAGSTRA